ncbi:MAG: transglycosylase SLT domain-containing protein [Burkholderiaceae bacterium]|nr:transglycosylase SLT domain-containing protein [Burkholderiaceae bacterium]
MGRLLTRPLPLTLNRALGWALAGALLAAPTAAPAHSLSLDELPRHAVPPPETGPVLDVQVEHWRREALALEHGDGVERDPLRAAELYCRAARYGDAEAQFNLAWMLTNGRGIQRDDAQAAHLFAAAAEQGVRQAQNMLRAMGTPRGAPPPCLRPPDADEVAVATAAPSPAAAPAPPAGRPRIELPWPPPPPQAPAPIVNFVSLVAPDFQLAPALVLAVMATESNFNASAVSPKNAQGLMQLIPDTARRFGVRDALDPAQNIRGGMAYLRWLLARFEGDVVLATAAYNAGEGAVERYRGVPPYAETRLYVRKILAHLGGRRTHPFDATVTPPSDLLPLMRGPGRWR